MANPKIANLQISDHSPHAILGLDPKEAVKRSVLIEAFRRARENVVDIEATAAVQHQQLSKVYWAYMQILRAQVKATKAREFEELLVEEEAELMELLAELLKPKEKSKTATPEIVAMTLPGMPFPNCHALLGTFEEVGRRFEAWLSANNLSKSLFRMETAFVEKIGQIMTFHGPKQGPHADAMSKFMATLATAGLIPKPGAPGKKLDESDASLTLVKRTPGMRMPGDPPKPRGA
jgi:hypothetical protein